MSNPLISVIMTAYNGERYIKDSIESVLNQTYKNFELIIALDGCTDDTEKIARRLQNGSESIINIIRHNDKKGCPFRRQELSSLVKGDFIAIQDADDISYPNRFEKEVFFLRNNPEVFCVGSFADKIDENGEIFGAMEYPPEKNEEIIRMIMKKCKNPMIDPSVMFRVSIFNEIGGYSLDKDIYTVPDFDLWLRAILADKKFYNIQEILTKYRVHNRSVTRSDSKMVKHHMIVWRRFMVEIFRRKRRNRGF